MSVLDIYRGELVGLADKTERLALAVYARWVTGTDDDTAALAIASTINRSNAEATALADTYLALQISGAAGEAVPTVGVLPVDDSARLLKAARTTLDLTRSALSSVTPHPITNGEPELQPQEQPAGRTPPPSATDATDPTVRLTRLARSEPMATAQRATGEAMQRQPLVEGWVRELHHGACQLCVWWSREGRAWPKAHPMPRHTGCLCSQRVVLRTSIKSTGFTRQLARNSA